MISNIPIFTVYEKIGIFSFTLLAITLSAYSQNRPTLSFGGGLSFNGTGDTKGYSFFNEVDLPFAHRLSVNAGLKFTNHPFQTSSIVNEFRFLTTGVSLYVNPSFHIIETANNMLSVAAGPILRYQHSTVPDSYGTRSTPTGQQFIEINYYEPMNILSLGYNVNITYLRRLSDRYHLGARLAFQNDSNADAISCGSILFGLKL